MCHCLELSARQNSPVTRALHVLDSVPEVRQVWSLGSRRRGFVETSFARIGNFSVPDIESAVREYLAEGEALEKSKKSVKDQELLVRYSGELPLQPEGRAAVCYCLTRYLFAVDASHMKNHAALAMDFSFNPPAIWASGLQNWPWVIDAKGLAHFKGSIDGTILFAGSKWDPLADFLAAEKFPRRRKPL